MSSTFPDQSAGRGIEATQADYSRLTTQKILFATMKYSLLRYRMFQFLSVGSTYPKSHCHMAQLEQSNLEADVPKRASDFLPLLISIAKKLVDAVKPLLYFLLLILDMNFLTGTQGESNQATENMFLDWVYSRGSGNVLVSLSILSLSSFIRYSRNAVAKLLLHLAHQKYIKLLLELFQFHGSS